MKYCGNPSAQRSTQYNATEDPNMTDALAFTELIILSSDDSYADTSKTHAIAAA